MFQYAPRFIFDAPGQTCNRFWSYLDTISWAVLNNKKVYILFWDESIKDYDALRNNKYVSFPFYNRFFMNLIGKDKWKRNIERYFYEGGDLNAGKFYNGKLGRYLGFIKGWPIRESDKYFPLVKDKVIPLFKPNKDIIDRINSLFEPYRINNSTVIIGVHIRRGDYKQWKNGKYYYDDDTINYFLKQIHNIFQNATQLVFYLASNEPISDKIREEIECTSIIRGSGSAVDDLYALSICDYIIGPPSTFTKWASIMGHVPLHIIYDKDEIISSVKDFSPLKSHSCFENEVRIW